MGVSCPHTRPCNGFKILVPRYERRTARGSPGAAGTGHCEASVSAQGHTLLPGVP